MDLRPITAPEQWYAAELSEAFPPSERKPLADILALMAAGRYELLGLYDGEALLGYATLWMEPADTSCILLDYLGVTAPCRGSGLGQEILRRLTERYQGRSLLLLESECPVEGGSPEENTLRRRRLSFYTRCGFRPIYQMATCGLRFQAFTDAPPVDLAPVMAVHRAIYGPGRTDVKIPLAPEESPPEPPYWMKGADDL